MSQSAQPSPPAHYLRYRKFWILPLLPLWLNDNVLLLDNCLMNPFSCDHPAVKFISHYIPLIMARHIQFDKYYRIMCLCAQGRRARHTCRLFRLNNFGMCYFTWPDRHHASLMMFPGTSQDVLFNLFRYLRTMCSLVYSLVLLNLASGGMQRVPERDS